MNKTKKLEELYKEAKLKEAGDEIMAMANRFKVRKEDVVFAVWKIAKDVVCAQLKMDLRYKKEEEKHLREKEKEVKQEK